MVIHIAKYTKIRKLRLKGSTYTEINNVLKTNIPKSSLSYICKDIVLTKKQNERIKKKVKDNARKALNEAVKRNRELFEQKIEKYYKQNLSIKPLMKDRNSMLIALAMLYLGEGSKWKSQRGLMLGSSNPKIIQTYISLLKGCYGITIDKMHCRIQHRADQNPNILLSYWTEQTGIKKGNFYKCYADKRTIGHPTKKQDYYGVCVVSCAGTHAQLELEQIADIINESTWGVSSVG